MVVASEAEETTAEDYRPMCGRGKDDTAGSRRQAGKVVPGGVLYKIGQCDAKARR